MDFLSYIKPELLILIPVLYALGLFFKSSKKISDNTIPVLLMVISIVLVLVWVFMGGVPSTGQEIATAIFTAIVQGVLLAAVAVFVNQLYKQSQGAGGSTDSTAQSDAANISTAATTQAAENAAAGQAQVSTADTGAPRAPDQTDGT